MIEQGSGLVVNISSHGAESYLLSVPYGVGKAAIDKVTRDTAFELQPHGVSVVSLWPGLVLTEGLLANTVLTDDSQQAGLPRARHQLRGDTEVQQPGRGRAGVGPGNPRAHRWLVLDGILAREYGFTEDDGHLPPEMANGILAGMGDEMPDYWKGVERAAPSEHS